MFLYMVSENLLLVNDALRAAVESGIVARQKVYGTSKGKRGNAKEEEQGREIMQATSARLLGMLELLEMAAGVEPQPRKEKARLRSLLSSFGSSLSSAPGSETDVDD